MMYQLVYLPGLQPFPSVSSVCIVGFAGPAVVVTLGSTSSNKHTSKCSKTQVKNLNFFQVSLIRVSIRVLFVVKLGDLGS